jgi:hypothetical protein
MPSTGQICPQSGIYSASCHHHGVKEIALSKGEKFPPCHTASCAGPATYTLKTPTR